MCRVDECYKYNIALHISALQTFYFLFPLFFLHLNRTTLNWLHCGKNKGVKWLNITLYWSCCEHWFVHDVYYRLTMSCWWAFCSPFLFTCILWQFCNQMRNGLTDLVQIEGWFVPVNSKLVQLEFAFRMMPVLFDCGITIKELSFRTVANTTFCLLFCVCLKENGH